MKPENHQLRFQVSPSPHTHEGSSVERIMLDVVIALLPALATALYFFGWHALRLTAICVVTCLLAEWLCRKAMRRTATLGDFSAVITGLLLAFNLPPALPAWMAVAGSLFAIVIAKQIFGGIGYNPFNPALAGRAFMLISFTGAMTTWSNATWAQKVTNLTIDATTHPTPLGLVKEALKAGTALPTFSPELLRDLFIGNVNGCIGETSAVALLLGAVYLLIRRVITWHIPLAYLGTVLIYALIMQYVAPASALPPLVHLLSGGLILGAFFMATDMVTTPLTRSGMLVFGVGCGLLTMIIRTVKSGAYPEGVSFAILIMNAMTPLINRATRRRVFGAPLSKKAVKAKSA